MTATPALPSIDAGWRADAAFLGRWILLGAGSGAIAGALIGGVGGRIAMFVLRLTSSDLLRGATTDDGFEIGVITGETVGLIILTTIIGAAGGIAYVALRHFVPPAWRVAAWALACGTFGGSVIITTEGIDFLLLEPLWLAVVMFIAIPLAGGAWTADLVERLRDKQAFITPVSVLGGLAMIPFLFGPILVAGPVFVLIVLAARHPWIRAGIDRWWSRTLALAAYSAIVALSSVALWNDVTTVL